jgi:hypothetical protein
VGVFPDGMAHSEIESVLQKQFPAPKKEPTTGFAGIKSDISKSISGLPDTIENMLSELPEQALGAAQHPLRSLGNIGLGLGEGAIGAFNAPHNLAQYLKSKDIPYFNKTADYVPHIPDLGIERALGMEEQQPGDALMRGLASFAVPGKLAKFGEAGLAKRAATIGGYATGQNEDPLQAMLMGELGGVAAKGLEKGLNKGSPKSMFRGTQTPQELAQVKELTKGTQTQLGEVLKSPTLKRLYENILPYAPFSGAEKVSQKLAGQLTEKGQGIIEKMRGAVEPELISEKLQQGLKAASKKAEMEKNAKFKKVNELAETNKVESKREYLRKAAKEALDEIQSDKDLGMLTEPSEVKLLTGLKNKGDDYSIKSTDILRGKLGKLAYEASVKGEGNKAGIYGSLKDALEKDVKHAIEKSNSSDLKSAHKEAMDYYRNDYVPFQDKDITKFTRAGADPDLLLNHFVRGGKLDRGILLNKLSAAVNQPEGKKGNLVGYSYLSRALDEEGNLNPLKLSTLYHNLGRNQRKAMFGEGKQAKEIKNFIDLVGKNKEAFNLLFNPKTGARNAELMTKGAAIGVGAAKGAAAGAVPLLASALLGKGATKLLTSEKIRNKLLDAMIENKQTKLKRTKKIAPIIGAISGEKQEPNKPMELYLNSGRRD